MADRANPKARPYEAHLVSHNGRKAVLIRDRLGLADRALVIPQEFLLLLALCDGTRDVGALRAGFELRTGIRLSISTIENFLQQLDEAFILDTPRVAQARSQALEAYRAAPHRPPACAGQVYPADAVQLRELIDRYIAEAVKVETTIQQPVRGLITPHIDFNRGWQTYAAVWKAVEETLQQVEVVVILGTDHNAPDICDPAGYIGGDITLTLQNYSTPFGILPTSRQIVNAIADAIGRDAAFANELHHRSEHSIELASVWLHYFVSMGHRHCEIVPILCGSFQHFAEGLYSAEQHPPFARFIAALQENLRGRRHIIIAAADLAHVGPAFGDSYPLDPAEKARVKRADSRLLERAASGDAEGFLAEIIEERDRRRVCGVPPIYLALRAMGQVKGKLVDYAQCPADNEFASLVSICGMVFS